jgi:tripeptide aminopeptidase
MAAANRGRAPSPAPVAFTFSGLTYPRPRAQSSPRTRLAASHSLSRVSEEQRLIDRFVRLCEIPSPTGSERAVADAVAAELRSLGVEVGEDGAAAAARAGAGNLVARISGRGDGWLMLCAHLDTVPVAGPISVAAVDGVLRSGGETILGGDDKAGVAALVELAADSAAEPPPVGLELVFTVAEERGLRGAKELDLEGLRSEVGLVLDHAGPLSDLVVAAPTYHQLLAEFEGVEAHAGLEPEAGRSAVAAAAAAVAAMDLGRLDHETTANVGTIEGGTAANVVAGNCRIEAEARSLDEGKASAAIGAIADACAWAASERECDLDVDVSELFRGYRLPPTSPALRLARAALGACGLEPHEVATGGGSDVNALRKRGFDCVLLSNGVERNHTAQESITVERLAGLHRVAAAAVEAAAC